MNGIISTENLSVIYDKGTPKEFSALKDITFSAESGEFIIVFGPSGCGKSTLLFTLSGIERHIDKGEAWINNKNVVTMGSEDLLDLHRKQLGMIFQAYNLIGTLNILNNVAMPLLAIGVPLKERNKRAIELLEHFGVGYLAKRYPAELSGGQQQRVAVARSLVTDPAIIFADEPTGNLDALSTEVVMKHLLDLREKEKKTIMMVTHDPTFLHYADRIVYLKDGNLVKVEKQKGTREFSPFPNNEQKSFAEVVSNNASFENNFGKSPYDQDRTSEFSLDQLPWVSIVPKFSTYIRKDANSFLESRFLRMFLDVAVKKLLNKDALTILRKPVVDGGFGYELSEAISILLEFNELQELREEILKFPPKERLGSLSLLRLSKYILGQKFGTFSSVQDRRFENIISDFLKKKIKRDEFLQSLENSVERGGVGLSGLNLNPLIDKTCLLEDLISE